VPEAQFGGCEIVRLRAPAVALLLGVVFATQTGAANQWGGSASLSSDYFVRGISRTSDHVALQLELHYANSAGLLAGVFASNSQIDPREREDAELSAFIGYAWNVSEEWRGKFLASHYVYPWNEAGSHYDYDELDFDLSFEGWLHFIVGYSPNSWRLYRDRYHTELLGVSEKSAEVSFQRQIVGKFSLTAGAGYSYLSGRESGGYAYWSGGAAYDLAPVTLALSYVDTTPSAKPLFYNAAATGQWMGTVLWRF
jgi:uncharacterized protein (TIGR02001 family)